MGWGCDGEKGRALKEENGERKRKGWGCDGVKGRERKGMGVEWGPRGDSAELLRDSVSEYVELRARIRLKSTHE